RVPPAPDHDALEEDAAHTRETPVVQRAGTDGLASSSGNCLGGKTAEGNQLLCNHVDHGNSSLQETSCVHPILRMRHKSDIFSSRGIFFEEIPAGAPGSKRCERSK